MNNPALVDDLGRKIVDLALIAVLSPNPDKYVFKQARKFQKESDCKITRNVMERICQFKVNCALASLETYKLLKSGGY